MIRVQNTAATAATLLARVKARVRESPLAGRFASGAVWATFGTLTSRLLNLAASVLAARMLGRDDYGAFGTVAGTIVTFQLLAAFGLGVTAVKHIAEARHSDKARAGGVLGLTLVVSMATGTVVAGALFAYAPVLAADVFNAPWLAGPLRIGAPAVALSAVNAAQTGVLAGFEAFSKSAKLAAVSALLAFAFTVGGIGLFGLSGGIWGYVLAALASMAANHVALRRLCREWNIRITLPRSRSGYSVLLRYSLPALLGAILVQPVNWLANVLLVRQPNGFAEAAVFTAANQWYTAVMFLPSVLGAAVLPMLAERMGAKDHRSVRGVFVASLSVNAAVAVPIALIGALFSPLIMAAYGPEFGDGSLCLIVALATAALVAMVQPVGDLLAATDRLWTGFALNACWAAVYLSAAAFSTDRGALGVLVARFGAYVLHAGWSLLLAHRYLRSDRAVATGQPCAMQ